MNKAYGITASVFSELIDKINSFAETHEIFSTQFLEPDRNTFYCVVWYNDKEQEKAHQEPQKQESKASNKVNSEEKPYKMSEQQWDILLKISNTEKGKEYLESKEYFVEEDLYDLTPTEAYKLINGAPKKKGGN